MIYFATPGITQNPAIASGRLGMIDTPKQGGRNVTAGHDAGALWCADNGCFSDAWDEAEWWAWLNHPDQLDHRATCAFAVAPDIVGDAWRSHLRSYPWLSRIRALGYPVAYVVQNRAERHPIPWHDFDVLFIGGCPECPEHGPQVKPIRAGGRGRHQRNLCTVCHAVIPEWKLGPAARGIITEGVRRGKWVHMGRVNGGGRYEYARALGCTSADGTKLTRGADKNLPRVLSWVTGAAQGNLFLVD